MRPRERSQAAPLASKIPWPKVGSKARWRGLPEAVVGKLGGKNGLDILRFDGQDSISSKTAYQLSRDLGVGPIARLIGLEHPAFFGSCDHFPDNIQPEELSHDPIVWIFVDGFAAILSDKLATVGMSDDASV